MDTYTGRIETTRRGEVIVCGGGCAGVAAAIASACSGAKTILLEKHLWLVALPPTVW